MQTLERRLGLATATTTNMLAMIGIGPFLTIPLLLQSMQGPQAMLGWIVGGVVAMADGLVWAELGAAMPASGGAYHYVLQAYGPRSWGRMMSFLYLWSIVISGPLLFASGAIGFAQYAGYLFPGMPELTGKLLAAGVCLLSTWLIYRRIDRVGHWGLAFGMIVLGTCLWIIVDGALHAHAANISLPPDAFRATSGFWYGLGGATLYAMYDYQGYNVVCGIGGEVLKPEATIPRSILIAILAVGALYLSMNFSIIGVLPWQQAAQSKFVVSEFMERLQGNGSAAFITLLILITALASLFGGMLGLSRVPFAAAADGRFFAVFARLHPSGHFPSFSVLYVGIASALCCLLDLETVIKGLTVAMVILGSLTVVVAPALLRRSRPREGLPFRMWAYPLPCIIAFAGWVYIIGTSGARYIAGGLIALLIGVLAYFWRARQTAEWPWAD